MKRHRLADPAAWAELVAACPGATFYHQPAWLAAEARLAGRRFEGWAIELPEGPIALVARRPARAVAGGYGGVLSRTPLSLAHVERVFRAIDATDAMLVGNPFHLGAHLPAPGAAYGEAGTITRVVGLPAPGGAPGGLDVRWVAGPREHLVDRFAALSPWGPARDRAFYYLLFREAGPHGLGLLSVHADDGVVACVLVGWHGTVAHVVGLATRRGADVEAARSALAALPAHLGPSLSWLDLGILPPAAFPSAWAVQARAVPCRVRRAWGARLLSPWKGSRREAS